MPRWGQLGCNGFIILDGSSKQRIVTKATSPFLQVRGLAFQHVEVLLSALLTGQKLPAVCPGQSVEIFGLQGSKHLNGMNGVCVEPASQKDDKSPARATIRLRSGKKVSIKVTNLKVQNEG